jgi:hypothetical protein
MKIQILGSAVLLSSALLGVWSEKASNRSSGQDKNRPSIKETLNVPMRDGIALRADIWRPSSDGRFPVLLYRTPYGRKSAEKEYPTFDHAVERGYAVLIQDVRGRYASGGEFRPYENEGHDGFDTIEWAAQQSWSNGDIGSFGLSYPRSGAMVGGSRESSRSESHGSGHDVFNSAKFLLRRRSLGFVVDRVDM